MLLIAKRCYLKRADEAHSSSSSSYEKEVEMQHQIEGKLKQDIDATLMTMFKPNEYKVNTKVSVNYDEVTRQSEKYGDKGVLRSKQEQEESSTAQEGQIRSKVLVLQRTVKCQITVRTIIKMEKSSTIIKW